MLLKTGFWVTDWANFGAVPKLWAIFLILKSGANVLATFFKR
jgi:hypothetical protein